MPLLKRLRTLAAKVENTIGTAESLTASEGAFNAYDVICQANIDMEDREAQGSFDMLSPVVGAQSGTLTFKTDLAWDGSAVPSWASVLLPGCGYVESTQVYYPTSEAPGSNVKTLTIGVFQDGLYKLLAGAMGTFKLTANAGKMAMIEWTFTGVWQAVTDSALIAPTYPTDKPLRFGNSTITWLTVAQCVEQVTFDAGNEVILRECPDTIAGYKSALIVSRKPEITFNPEQQLVADDAGSDKYGDWIAGTEGVFSCAIDGPTGVVSNGNVTFAAPQAQITNVQESDRNSLVVDEVTLACNKNGANKDQDVSITFTDKADV